jgi:hypothetical protein
MRQVVVKRYLSVLLVREVLDLNRGGHGDDSAAFLVDVSVGAILVILSPPCCVGS